MFAAAKKAEFAANWLLASELGSKSTPWPNPEQSLPIPAFRLPNCCWLSRNMLIPIYVGADGKQTDEVQCLYVQCLYSAMKPLREIYEATARNLRFDTDQGFLARYKDTPARERLLGIGRAVFSNIVRQACGKAGVPKFVRHQLRHTAGTRIRDAFGIERAQAHLFHSNANMTFL